MPISIRPLRNEFAGEVAGVDITRPMSREEVAAIDAGMDKYAVLVFHDQDLTDEQQLAFTLNFGALESYQTPGHVRKREDHRLGPGMADFSNLDKDGNIMSDEDRVWFFKLGDQLWHSDSSFRPVPAKYSLLSGRVLPSWGANTEFADMRAAYDALDDRTKAEVATRDRFVYGHEWRVGDLVIWDNRCTMHRARRFDRNEVRDVRRTTLAGDAAIPAKAAIEQA